jgi:diguanylate cyclase (GGDEF)-like protein
MYIDKGYQQEALNILTSSLSDTESTYYPRILAEYYALLAKIYWHNENPKLAQNYALKALKNEKKMRTTQAKVLSYRILYEIALSLENSTLALDYYRKYAEAEKSFLNEIQSKHLAFQLAEHNAFEQESQIKLLNEQNSALAIEQALAKTRATNKKLIILSLGLIILVLTFFGIRFWHTHKRVRQLAEYDLLTGIYNRGHFTQVTQSALKYCQNAEQDLSLIMFDLDHFKKVNDDFGHACGDWALKETIKVCKDIGRKNDVFARLGGEEFCLVLPSCNIDVAMLRAEACRIAIESIITEESGHDFAITASFGVTDVKRSGFDLDSLLADADMAAYDSKKSGRNKVTVHQVPEKKTEPLDNSWSI